MTNRQRLIFVLPPESGLISGGNIYNRELLDAVRRRHPIEEVSEEEWTRLVAEKTIATFFVDTVSLRRFLDVVPVDPPAGQRFILVVHHLPSLEPGLTPGDPSLAIESAALPRFDAFLATSPYTAAFLRSRGFAHPCLVVPPALPEAERPPLAYRPGVRALLVGNLIPRKGVLPFVRALAARLQPGDPITARVVGRSDLDPAHAAECVRAAQDAGLTDDAGAGVVSFRGPIAYDAMAALYRDSSVFVSASLMETFGMALQEARAFGIPILACRGGNTAAHVVEGVSGHLFDSVEPLVERLLALARAPGEMRRLFEAAQSARSGAAATWAGAAADLLRQLGDFC